MDRRSNRIASFLLLDAHAGTVGAANLAARLSRRSLPLPTARRSLPLGSHSESPATGVTPLFTDRESGPIKTSDGREPVAVETGAVPKKAHLNGSSTV